MAKFTGKSPSTDKAFAFGPRVRVDAGDVFPDEATVGVAPFRDLEGRPLYVGTVILDDGAIPCYVRLPVLKFHLANSRLGSDRSPSSHPG